MTRGVRAALRAVVAGALALGTALAVPLPARAADTVTNTGTNTGTKQVTVTIEKLEPKVVKADSTITVSGVLTNTTRHPLTSPWIRLQSGLPLTSRSQLTADPPPSAGSYFCAIQDLGASLQPGHSQRYTVSCPASQLGLNSAGTYPLTVNVNAIQFDGTKARVGEADTSLPFYPDQPKSPTKVSWLWPIVDRPHQFTAGMVYSSGHRLPSGVFRDDALASSLARTGRLGRLVSTALGAPSSVQLTVPIDPELVAEVSSMRDGYRVAQGSRTVAGVGAATASQWFNRLVQLVKKPNVTVVPLPYADPDLVALADGGMSQQIGPAYEQGATALRKLLPLRNTLPLAWPVDGELDNTTLYSLAGQSLAGVVVSPDALPLTASKTPTPGAAAEIPAQGSSLPAVVTDRSLDQVVGTRTFDTGVRLIEQRFISELAMITAEAPANARNVVIAPPRHWASSPTFLRDVLADTASLPWATTAKMGDALSATPAARRGSLEYPATARAKVLPEAQITAVGKIASRLNGFRETLSNSDANTVLTPYYKGVLTAISSAWRDDRDLGISFLRDLSQAVSGIEDRVYIVAPSTKQRTYTLASSSSPLVLTVANTLGVAVKVQIHVNARGGSAGFHADSRELSVPPRTRSTVKVPAHVERSGTFSVIASVQTPGGQPLGSTVQLRVRSTAYGAITLGITGGAFGLLLILVARRFYRRYKLSRQPAAPPDRSVEYPTGEYPRLTPMGPQSRDHGS